MRSHLRPIAMAASALTLSFLAGCHTDMWRQNKVLPQKESDFFMDSVGSRPLPAHTVARSGAFGHPEEADLRTGNPFYTGYTGSAATHDMKLVAHIPDEALTQFGGDKQKMLLRGQERFNIFCSPCHGRLGDGNGMIAQRGFNIRRKPANYHTDRLRRVPDGHIFDVITNGFGVMYSYASRVEPSDRWAIISYVRALQLSQNATVNEVPAGRRADLDRPAGVGQGATEGGAEQ